MADNLPTLTPTMLPAAPDTDVSVEADFSSVKKTDVLALNYYIKMVGAALPSVTSIDEVCKAALTAGKLLQLRRRMLCMPDAYKGSDSQEALVLPLD